MPNKVLPFVEVGAGRPLLMVHGFPFDHRSWAPQLENPPAGSRLIVPDLRGFGKQYTAKRCITMEEHAADLCALLDHLGLEQAVIAGLSMGGYVALAFAEAYPARLAGLALCNTRATADNPEVQAGRERTARMVMEQGLGSISDGLLAKLFHPATPQEVRNRVLDMMLRQPPSGVAASARGMAARPDRSGILAGITAPTAVITGSDDGLIPLAESQALQAAIPGATLTVVPNVGHLTNLEAPEAFSTAIGELLARC